MNQIQNNPELLDLLWNDMLKQNELHRPGPFWERKMRNTYDLIKRDGLQGFRSNGVGLSFADNPPIDILDQYAGSKLRYALPLMRRVPLFPQILGAQRFWTQANYDRAVAAEAKLFSFQAGDWLDEMLEDFPDLPRGIEEGCEATMEWRGELFSTYYLKLLSYIDVLRKGGIDFSKVDTVLEVGGGMGTNLHLLLTLFPNIKKAVLVDVPPVLYVAGQYLQKFFPGVRTYQDFSQEDAISFTEGADEVEIIALPPWCLPRLEAKLDLAWNSNSFVEMMGPQIEFYLGEIGSRLNSGGTMAMISYDNSDGGALNVSDLLSLVGNNTSINEVDAERWRWLWTDRIFHWQPRAV